CRRHAAWHGQPYRRGDGDRGTGTGLNTSHSLSPLLRLYVAFARTILRRACCAGFVERTRLIAVDRQDHQFSPCDCARTDMDAQTQMLAMIRDRRPGFSLAQPFYTDPDFFRLDMEMIWYRDWLFVGHDCELAKPGSYFTLQVGD